MHAHIVHAHFDGSSFTAAMRDVVEQQLKSMAYTVGMSDLYRMGFNPLVSRSDFIEMESAVSFRYTAAQREAYATGRLCEDIRTEVKQVLSADLLVLTFPVFWFSVPAIMKGWIERVFLSGPFYGPRNMYERGGMRGKRALVAASLGGRAAMFRPEGRHGALETGMLKHLLMGTLGCVGYEVVQPFFAFEAPYIAAEDRAEVLHRLRMHVRNLNSLPALSFS